MLTPEDPELYDDNELSEDGVDVPKSSTDLPTPETYMERARKATKIGSQAGPNQHPIEAGAK